MNLLPSDLLKVTTSGTATVDVHADWHDGDPTRPNRTNTAFTVTATKTVVGAPGNHRTVTGLSIRNTDTASVTVTVIHSDGTLSPEIYKATLAAGGQLHYVAGAGWTPTAAATLGVTYTLIAPADVANVADNTLANVTGLTFAVVAGRTYRFRAHVPYSSAATTTGSRFTANGPALTALNGTSSYTIDATTRTLNNFTAWQIPAAANATSLTVGNLAIVEGTFTPSASGTFAIQFASEVAASAVTALAGATLDYTWVLGA
jgi:hypothetical protein